MSISSDCVVMYIFGTTMIELMKNYVYISETLILSKHIENKNITLNLFENLWKSLVSITLATFCLSFILEKVDKHLSCADDATLQEKLTGFFVSNFFYSIKYRMHLSICLQKQLWRCAMEVLL